MRGSGRTYVNTYPLGLVFGEYSDCHGGGGWAVSAACLLLSGGRKMAARWIGLSSLTMWEGGRRLGG